MTKRQADQLYRATIQAKVGDWGWSIDSSRTPAGQAAQNVRDEVRSWLGDETNMPIQKRRGSIEQIFGSMSNADSAGKWAEGLVAQRVGESSTAGVWADDLAWIAVALDTFGHDPSLDPWWDRAVELWNEVASNPTNYPDPISEAWSQKPGSISWCLARSLIMMLTGLAAVALALKRLR
jgi:hypothetical protein